jgi:hypothetical protein
VTDKLAVEGALEAKFPVSREVKVGDPLEYIVKATVIGAESVALYRQEFLEESVDGNRTVNALGEFEFTSDPNAKVTTPLDTEIAKGLIILLDSTGTSVGVASQSGRVIPFGDPTLIEKDLGLGKVIGYKCTCPDFAGSITTAYLTGLGTAVDTWRTLGAIGACKHILALRITRDDLVSIPSDVPVVEDEVKPTRNPFSASRFGVGKFGMNRFD